MTPQNRVKKRSHAVQLVGVITSRAELRRAIDLEEPPDLFEIRLDYFDRVDHDIRDEIARLRAPLIVTARAADLPSKNESPFTGAPARTPSTGRAWP